MKIETLPFLVVHGALLWKVALGLLIFLSLWRPFRKGPLAARLKPLKTALFHSVGITLAFLASAFIIGQLARALEPEHWDDDTPRSISFSEQIGAALPFHRSRALDRVHSAASSMYHQTEKGQRILAELKLLEHGCEDAANSLYYPGYPLLVLEALE
ncbi:MAG: hypothetical protein JKY56_26300, partial [Kofleriaceae bacterium]|nr:hypothetical protein [Kofleriaceae bacterium]